MRSMLAIAGRLASFKQSHEVIFPRGPSNRKRMGNWKTFVRSQGICSMVVPLMASFTPFPSSEITLHTKSENNDGP